MLHALTRTAQGLARARHPRALRRGRPDRAAVLGPGLPRVDRRPSDRPGPVPAPAGNSLLHRARLFDLGITGRDWIAETEADVVSLGELQYSKATSRPVRVVLAVPDSVSWQSAADL